MLKRLYLVLIIYTLSAVFIEAKGLVKISGVVTNSENEHFEFVTVKFKGPTTGPITEAGGRSSLIAPEADPLRWIFP